MCNSQTEQVIFGTFFPSGYSKGPGAPEAHVTLRRGPSLQNTLPSCPPQAASWPSGELETVQPASSRPCVKYNHVWQYLGVQQILTDPKAFLGRGTACDANRGRATVQATRQGRRSTRAGEESDGLHVCLPHVPPLQSEIDFLIPEATRRRPFANVSPG